MKREGKRALGRLTHLFEDNVKVIQKNESGKVAICAHICLTSSYIIQYTTLKKETDTYH